MRWSLGLAALAAAWGFVSIIIAGVELASEALVFWRCALAVVVLLAILAARRHLELLRVRANRGRILLLAVALGFHWLFFFESLKRTSVAVAILALYTAPIFVAILGPRLLPERQSRIGLIALAISAPGLALIALAGEGGTSASPTGLAFGVAAAILFAFLLIGAKSLGHATSSFVFSFWQYLIVGLVFLPLALANADALPGGVEWIYVLLLGVLFTGISGPVHFWLLRHSTAQAAGLLAYVEPVSASLLAWAILDQPVGWAVALGGALVIAAGALVVVAEAAAAAPPPALAHGAAD